MKKNIIITLVVITIVMISPIVLNTNCKGKANIEESGTIVAENDKISDSGIAENVPGTQEKESYPRIACGCHTTMLLREDGTGMGLGKE